MIPLPFFSLPPRVYFTKIKVKISPTNILPGGNIIDGITADLNPLYEEIFSWDNDLINPQDISNGNSTIINLTYNSQIIDTVERLQGQDVDCIILTFASSAESYIETIRGFLFNPNRLNVMISRAKTKVVIFAGEMVQREFKGIFK